MLDLSFPQPLGQWAHDMCYGNAPAHLWAGFSFGCGFWRNNFRLYHNK